VKRIFQFAVIAVSVCMLSCEKTEVNKVAEAQACLDSATDGATAAVCSSKVDGIETPSASRIRVGAVFIQRGFTKTTFVNAYNQLKTPPAGVDSTLAVFAYLGFSGVNTYRGNATSTQDSDYVVAEALKAASGGLYWLATGAKIGTLGITAGATFGNPSTFTAGVVNGMSSAELGALAIQTNEFYCKNSSATSSTACKEFVNAVNSGGADPVAVGNALKALLNNPS
jgi:hypothetical protein